MLFQTAHPTRIHNTAESGPESRVPPTHDASAPHQHANPQRCAGTRMFRGVLLEGAFAWACPRPDIVQSLPSICQVPSDTYQFGVHFTQGHFASMADCFVCCAFHSSHFWFTSKMQISLTLKHRNSWRFVGYTEKWYRFFYNLLQGSNYVTKFLTYM